MVEVHSFVSEHLPEEREVLVYLPPGWEEADGLPVLYMQDGQNLFAGRDGSGPSWDVDTTASTLIADDVVDPLIIVGVANTAWRDEEYTPSEDLLERTGGYADQYLDFLVGDVKAFVDSHYPVRPFREDTGIGGSSLGGLLSLYAAMTRPEIFGKVAAMSASLWWDDHVILDVARAWDMALDPIRIWLDVGFLEQDEEEAAAGEPHPVDESDRLHEILLAKGLEPGEDLVYLTDPWGSHDEASWGRRFGQALAYLFAKEQA